MTHHSNYWGNVGGQTGSTDPSTYKRNGASDSQAAEAAAAARAAQQKTGS